MKKIPCEVWGIILFCVVIGLFLVAGYIFLPQYQADDTDQRAEIVDNRKFSGKHACNCIPEDIAKSLTKMGQVAERLNEELNIVKAQETDAQAALAEARAEIERLQEAEIELLQKEIERVKEMKDSVEPILMFGGLYLF